MEDIILISLSGFDLVYFWIIDLLKYIYLIFGDVFDIVIKKVK